jgi:GNAT superfamily N-acetyltransferase
MSNTKLVLKFQIGFKYTFCNCLAELPTCTFSKRLKHSLLYICAFDNHSLIGFVNVAWDGGIHGFILDTTVHANYQREGIGINLIRQAALAAKARGIEWLHVDYEPHLTNFYKRCGFFPTEAGLLDLTRYCI